MQLKKINIEKFDLDLYYEKLNNGLEIYVIPKNNCNNIYRQTCGYRSPQKSPEHPV